MRLNRFVRALLVFSIPVLAMVGAPLAVADDNDTVPVADMGDDGIPRIPVKLHLPSGQYAFTHSELSGGTYVQLVVQSEPCEEEGCVPRDGGHPANTIFSFNNKVFNWEPGDDTIEDVLTFPDANEVFPKPGVYSFTLDFKNWANSLLIPVKDGTYRMRVYVVQDGEDLKYSAVTIENGDGEKIDTIEEDYYVMGLFNGFFYKDVVNNTGLPEEGPYTFKLTLREPEEAYLHAPFTYVMTNAEYQNGYFGVQLGELGDNSPYCYAFDTDDIYGEDMKKPDSEKIAGIAYSEYIALSEEEKVAAWNSNPTVECTYTLNDGDYVSWAWHMDGRYEIEEIVPDDAKFSSKATRKDGRWAEGVIEAYAPGHNFPREDYLTFIEDESDSKTNGVVAAPFATAEYFGGDENAQREAGLPTGFYITSVVKFTNTYDDIPPTGILLEYMPYVLMTLIPLGAIGAYVAMRRKLLS